MAPGITIPEIAAKMGIKLRTDTGPINRFVADGHPRSNSSQAG
jgi:hypothetical protein